MENNTLWKSKLGFVLAASGSAIGLGNIWKFPYMISQYGGGAFLLIYIACIIIIGYPLIVSETAIGRKSRQSPFHAYESKNIFWRIPGIAAFIATLIVVSYYMVIAGWAVRYIFSMITGEINFHHTAGNNYINFFSTVLGSYWSLILYTLIFYVVTCYISLRGVNSGIEKLNKYAMPSLFIILIVLAIRALTLEGGLEAAEYLFIPDISKINSSVVVAALGQSFFSLSLATGIIITYSVYLNKKENILKSSAYTVGLDTLVGILAAVIVVPIVFSFGHDLDSGPSLTFITLPYMFASMKGGIFFAFLFFILLIIAALTSTVSIIEALSLIFKDMVKDKITRNQSIIIVSLSAFIISFFQAGSFNVLSSYTFNGMTIFDITDYIASNVLFPLGGLLTAIYVGYILPKKELIKELESGGTVSISSKFIFVFSALLRYIIPVVIIIIMLNVTGLVKF